MKRRGVITVEAALVMPVILGCIFLLYSLAMIQYGNIVTRTEAMRTANRVAMNWNVIGGKENNILTEDRKSVVYAGELSSSVGKSGKYAISSDTYKEHDPYRFFFELFGTGSQKKENINQYLTARMGSLSEQTPFFDFESMDELGSDSAIHIFNRYVRVKIQNTFHSPMIGLLAQVGYCQKDTYNITVKAKLTDPADFVRNVSYIEEIIRKNKKKGER